MNATQGSRGIARIAKLSAWQEEAIEAGRRAGDRGVVEAVIGCRRETAVAHPAIADALDTDRPALVAVPTIDLQDRWCGGLQKAFPSTRLAAASDRRLARSPPTDPSQGGHRR